MKLTKRSFSLRYNIEVQWVSALCEMGIIQFEIKPAGKIPRILIDESVMSLLKLGIHFVECPNCNKKMSAVTKKHYKDCPSGLPHKEPMYSKLFLDSHKKTEEQKLRQSETLKNRFQTDEGEVTRKQIGEASRKLNLDPEYKKRQSIIFTEIQNRPENKIRNSSQSLKRWADPEFRLRMKKYVEGNKKEIDASAHRARKHQKKRNSKVHARYKENMVKAGIDGFITEYQFDFYRIDEADPLAKIAIEIDDCYWHGCEFCGFPGVDRIIATDHRKEAYLKNRDWKVIRIKEHELKKNPNIYIELIKELQIKRKKEAEESIRKSFFSGDLRVKSMVNKSDNPEWVTIEDVFRHSTPNKKMLEVFTKLQTSSKVTEDHSLFDGNSKDPIKTVDLKKEDKIVGLINKKFGSLEVSDIKELPAEKHTYDLSVPGAENFVLDSGILAHNSYSISGVSLDIDKSSKYQSMKENFIAEYDKVLDAAKRSIKIIRGLRQPRYGIGISSALGPFSRPGVQSRANWVRGVGFS